MKSWIVLPLVFFAAAACAEELIEFEFSPPAQSEQDRGTSPVCAFTNLELPDTLRVYAAGGYSGRLNEFQIDQSGHASTQFDVAVNSPAEPVALMLGAYEPTIWNIGWTQGTRIVAVLVSGYHRQAVAGLASDVPVLNSSYDNQGPCGYFHVGKEQNRALNPLSRTLFQKPVDMVFPGDRSGKIVVGKNIDPGAKLLTSAVKRPGSFRDANALLAGQAGLEEAIGKGLLRPATDVDASAWITAVAAKAVPEPDAPPVAGQRAPAPRQPRMHKAYVVLGKFTYPAGLHGAHSATFFIPKGLPRPTGNPGHSAVYDFNTLACQGPC